MTSIKRLPSARLYSYRARPGRRSKPCWCMQELLIKGYARGDAATNSVELSQRLSMEENALFQVETCIGKRVQICSVDVQISVQPFDTMPRSAAIVT
jgi:hypothetical protein